MSLQVAKNNIYWQNDTLINPNAFSFYDTNRLKHTESPQPTLPKISKQFAKSLKESQQNINELSTCESFTSPLRASLPTVIGSLSDQFVNSQNEWKNRDQKTMNNHLVKPFQLFFYDSNSATNNNFKPHLHNANVLSCLSSFNNKKIYSTGMKFSDTLPLRKGKTVYDYNALTDGQKTLLKDLVAQIEKRTALNKNKFKI